MNFRNIEKLKNGDYAFDVEASKDEVSFLVDYAISNLLTQGMINIQDGATMQEISLSAGNEALQ